MIWVEVVVGKPASVAADTEKVSTRPLAAAAPALALTVTDI